MANPEHVEVVRLGEGAVRRWRAQHEDILFDLRGANLGGADLSGVWLSRSNLRAAHLRSADLSAANLWGADFSRADLSGADLSGADLFHTNLREARLAEADFSEAFFSGTILADADLTGALGLSDIRHQRPSIIDTRTLKANPDLPEIFLRGIGLTDDEIQLYHSWQGAIQFYSSFISYAHEDESFASRLYDALQSNGVRCWLDSHDLAWGAKTRRAVFDAIRLHDRLVVVLSEASLASDWVEAEVERALAKERETGRTVLFPVRIDDAIWQTDTAWALHIKDRVNIGDMTAWESKAGFASAFDSMLKWLRESEASS